MLKVLFKIQMTATYNFLFMRANLKKKNKRKLNRILIAVLAVYVVLALMISAGVSFYQLAVGYEQMGLGWVYFANAALMAFGMSVVMSVFMSQSLLFEAKDNELLLSLPIKPSHILGSRLLVLGVIIYVVTLIYLIPAGIVYVVVANPGFMFYPFFIISMLLLPLLALAVAALFGYIISFITGRMRNKSLFVTIFSLALLVGYMWVYTGISSSANNLVANGASIGEAIKKTMPPFYYFGLGIARLDVLSLLMFALWTIIPFLLMYALLSKAFIKIATTKHQAKKLIYREGAVQSQSAFKALLKKEMGKFLGSPMYLLNCGIAFLMTIALGVYVALQGSNILATIFLSIPEMREYVVPIIILLLALLAGMGITTSPSISLEGKNLWIIKSSPLRVSEIFNAKIMLNILFGVGALLVADVCVIYALRPSVIQAVLIILIPIAIQVFAALEGLICNLYFPKLDFTNESIVIKQSASVLLSMLITFAVNSVLIIGYIFLFKGMMSFDTFAVGTLVLLIALNVYAYRFIMSKGVTMFNRL